jgi:hypothetical protein
MPNAEWTRKIKPKLGERGIDVPETEGEKQARLSQLEQTSGSN